MRTMPKIKSYHPALSYYRQFNRDFFPLLKKKAIKLFHLLPLKSDLNELSLISDFYRSTKNPHLSRQYYALANCSLKILKPVLKSVHTLSFSHCSRDLKLSKTFYQSLTNLKFYKTTIPHKDQLRPFKYLKGVKSLDIFARALLEDDQEILMKLGKHLQHISSLKNVKVSLPKAYWTELLCFLGFFPSGTNIYLSLYEIEGNPWLLSLDMSSVDRIKGLKLDKYPASLLEYFLRRAEIFEGLVQLDLLSCNWGLAINKHKDMRIFSRFRSLKNLKSLKVNFQLSYPNSESTEEFLEFFQIPEKSLENLHLELNNFAPTDKDPKALKFYGVLSQIQNCSKLTNLHLKFEFCQLKSNELYDLAAHLPHNLGELKVLTLKIECFEVVLDVSGLCNWLKSLGNLEYLELILPGISPSNTSIESLELPKLKKLHIQLTPSYSPTEEVIKVLFDFLRNIDTITWLTLDFSSIEMSTKTIELIVKALMGLKNLNQLRMSLSGEYGQLDALLRFQTLFRECPALKYLNLDTKIFVPWEAFHAKEEKFKEHFRAEKSKYGKALAIQVKNGTLL